MWGVWLHLSKATYGQPQAMLKVDGFLPMGLFKSNFVMFLKPCRSQTSHGHIHSVQRISVRSGLSQYPFVNLVGKSSALECLFSGLGGKTHTEGHTNTYACTFPHIFQRHPHIDTSESLRRVTVLPKVENTSPLIETCGPRCHSG